MLNEGTALVLIAVADRDRRREIAQTLHMAGFEVLEAQDHDDAVTLLHASSRHLVMLVDANLVSVLHFAAADRRLARHHIYIALDSADVPFGDAVCLQFPCLTLWRLTAPTPANLTRIVTKAAHLLEADPARWHELVTR